MAGSQYWNCFVLCKGGRYGRVLHTEKAVRKRGPVLQLHAVELHTAVCGLACRAVRLSISLAPLGSSAVHVQGDDDDVPLGCTQMYTNVFFGLGQRREVGNSGSEAHCGTLVPLFSSRPHEICHNLRT